MELDLSSKTARLRQLIADMDSVAVAFSGGVDSSLLLAICLQVLGVDRVLALTVRSALIPTVEVERASAVARHLGARHRLVDIDLLHNPDMAVNSPDRCYHCKHMLLTRLWDIARAEGLAELVHGANADDLDDYRPGQRAAEELNVRAPLLEAGFTKEAVRTLSRQMNLPTWDLPAAACLASRVPYGTPLTAQGLDRVESAESFLREKLGLGQLRVRDHYPLARIEVPEGDLLHLAHPDARRQIIDRFRALGYHYVTMDLEGFRSGRLNEPLSENEHIEPQPK